VLFKLKLLRCPQTIRNEGALVVDHQTFETTSDSKILGRISLTSLHFIQLKFFASSQNPSRLGLCQARMAESFVSVWHRLAYAAIPLSWYAIRATNSNLPGIELLARENLLPEQATIQGHVTGLNAFIKRIYGITPHTQKP
jgi:hypothetical protein